jgi:hypothetical protein
MISRKRQMKDQSNVNFDSGRRSFSQIAQEIGERHVDEETNNIKQHTIPRFWKPSMSAYEMEDTL